MLADRIINVTRGTRFRRIHYFQIGDTTPDELTYIAIQPLNTTIEYIPFAPYTHIAGVVRYDFPKTNNSPYISTGDGIDGSSTRDAVIPALGAQALLLVINEEAEIPLGIIKLVNHPSYYDLINGYELDSRIIPENLILTSTTNKNITIKYYQQNKLEPIPDLKSICWRVFQYKIVANIPLNISIKDIVLGTLHVSDSSVLITSVSGGYYPSSALMLNGLANLFQEWNTLYENQPFNLQSLPVYQQVITLRKIAANNDVWNNANLATNLDINYLATHPMFAVDNQRAYNWHIKPQPDGSIGDLLMDSPRTIETNQRVSELYNALQASNYLVETPATIGTGTAENPETPAKHTLAYYIVNGANSSGSNPKLDEIHRSLNAGKWGKKPTNTNPLRQDDLGWRIERMNEVLGIRVGANLKFNPTKEKSMVRRVIKSDQNLDPEKVGVNNFGSDGMVVKRINNRFSGNKIESDQCVIVQDVLQLIHECHEQHNLAVGIQESSAIEIKEGKNRARFDNQLGLLVEMFNLLTSANEMTRAALISSLVSQSQTNEIIAGLGLPSVTKTIPVSIDKKVTQLPYKGIAPHRSISQEVATCTANVGIVLGQLL